MKEACINRIYSVTDQVPQFSFTTLLHEVTPRSRQIGKIRPIVVLFCCYPQSFKHKKTNKQRKQRIFRNFCGGLYQTDKQVVFINVISVKPTKSTQMRFHTSSNHKCVRFGNVGTNTCGIAVHMLANEPVKLHSV